MCVGLLEKMYVTAHSLPAPVPLDDQFTTHWPRIPVSFKCHGGAWSLCIGVIDPFGKEFGSLDTNSARVLIPLLERNLVRLQASVVMDTIMFEHKVRVCSSTIYARAWAKYAART